MRDVSIEEFAEELRDALSDMGVNLSKGTVQILTREFFYNVENILLKKKETRFSMYNRDLSHVYWPLDKQKLCNEFANGEGVSVHRLIKLNKLSKAAKKFYKQRMSVVMNEKAMIQ